MRGLRLAHPEPNDNALTLSYKGSRKFKQIANCACTLLSTNTNFCQVSVWSDSLAMLRCGVSIGLSIMWRSEYQTVDNVTE